MEKDESRWNRWVRVSQRLRNGFQMAMVSCYIQQYHSEQVPTQPQEVPDQSVPPTPSVTELPRQAPAAPEKPPAKPKAPPAKPLAPAPKTPPSGGQPSELPSKPAKRPKTLYESSRPPADF